MNYLVAYKFDNPDDLELDSVPNAIYNIDQDAICLFDTVWLIVTELSSRAIHSSIRPLLSD